MNYRQTQSYLNSFINYERSPIFPYKSSFKTERVRRFLLLLDEPYRDLRVIHVAGSKGKGSTSAFLAHILREAGYKVGLYTSPHLVDVRERICILEDGGQKMIPRRDFARLVKKIKPAAERMRDTEFGRLSYFEVLTALGFLFFKEKKCDFVVLETGLGGRLDATNVARSLAAVITPISYEHTQVLGSTLEEIAREKAGIIKPGTGLVVSAPQKKSVMKIFRQRAKENNADFFQVAKDIRFKRKAIARRIQHFSLTGASGAYPELSMRLLGLHQIVNAATAVACIEALRKYDIVISRGAIARGLRKTRWPGRLQLIQSRPRILVDGAQNKESARVLKNTLRQDLGLLKPILIFGVCRDKDVRGMLDELLPCTERIILTKSRNPRAMEPEAIKSLIGPRKKEVTIAGDLKRALEIAGKAARADDTIVITGSLFLVGEALLNKGKCR